MRAFTARHSITPRALSAALRRRGLPFGRKIYLLTYCQLRSAVAGASLVSAGSGSFRGTSARRACARWPGRAMAGARRRRGAGSGGRSSSSTYFRYLVSIPTSALARYHG